MFITGDHYRHACVDYAGICFLRQYGSKTDGGFQARGAHRVVVADKKKRAKEREEKKGELPWFLKLKVLISCTTQELI